MIAKYNDIYVNAEYKNDIIILTTNIKINNFLKRKKGFVKFYNPKIDKEITELFDLKIIIHCDRGNLVVDNSEVTLIDENEIKFKNFNSKLKSDNIKLSSIKQIEID